MRTTPPELLLPPFNFSCASLSSAASSAASAAVAGVLWIGGLVRKAILVVGRVHHDGVPNAPTRAALVADATMYPKVHAVLVLAGAPTGRRLHGLALLVVDLHWQAPRALSCAHRRGALLRVPVLLAGPSSWRRKCRCLAAATRAQEPTLRDV